MTLQLLAVEGRRCREQQSEGCPRWKEHLTLNSSGFAQVYPIKYLFQIQMTGEGKKTKKTLNSMCLFQAEERATELR